MSVCWLFELIVPPVPASQVIEVAANAGSEDTRFPPRARSKAAPTDTSFLKLIELVISSRKPKTGLKTGLKKGFTPANQSECVA
ncbi:MAG: hypothetical protein RIQ31_989 [Actinomycetota bacterium]